LVCIVEGHGERDAIPVLCNRIVRSILGVDAGWYIDEDPVRHPRSRLVDEAVPSPLRSAHADGLARALRLAAARAPDAILVVCDRDDDCPATWGPSVPGTVLPGFIPVAAVMASREYESWLLAGYPLAQRTAARAIDPDKAPRDAKRALARLVPDYAPATHQVQVTRNLDLTAAWKTSDSFDKLVRSLAVLVRAPAPARPTR
jgi:hypothetical protein